MAFVLIVVLVESVAVIAFGIDRPAWNDEGHFHRTVEYFGQGISLDTLKHYEEMSTPLPFIVYAWWGRLAGFELAQLRILTLICSLITYLVFFHLLWILVNDPRAVFWSALWLVINPYMIGLSIFIYTDMMTIMFVVLALLARVRKQALLFGLAMALGILSRQYVVFLTLACLTWDGFQWLLERKREALKMLAADLLSLVPYGLLILLWGGAGPDNSLRGAYLTEGVSFHPTHLTLYLCLLFVFHVPLIAARWREIYLRPRVVIISLILSFAYYLVPVTAVKTLLFPENAAVGLFHRFLRMALANESLVNAAFQLCLLMALPVLLYFIEDTYRRLSRRLIDLPLLLDLALFSFLIIMPWSYFVWEKYVLLLVPIVIIRILLIKNARVLVPAV